MMDLFSRYVFRQAAGAIMTILTTLALLVWIATALKQLELMTAQNQTFWLFFKMTTMTLPTLLLIIAPLALIISSIHTLNRLNNDSELIILTAAGTSIWRITIPFLLLGSFVTAFVMFGNFYLQPKSLRMLKGYIVKVRTDMVSSVLQSGKFSRAEKGLTFHIRDRAKNGELLGLLVHDTRNPKEGITFMSKRARVIKRDGSAFMVMFEGHINRHKTGSEDVEIIAFDQYMVNLSSLDKQSSKAISYRAKESYLSELYAPPKDNVYFKAKPGKWRAEFHERLTTPLYPTLYILLIVGFLGHARTTRHGRTNAVVVAFVSSIFFRVMGLATTNMVVKNPSAVPLLYIIPLAGIIFALFLIYSRTTSGRKNKKVQSA